MFVWTIKYGCAQLLDPFRSILSSLSSSTSDFCMQVVGIILAFKTRKVKITALICISSITLFFAYSHVILIVTIIHHVFTIKTGLTHVQLIKLCTIIDGESQS